MYLFLSYYLLDTKSFRNPDLYRCLSQSRILGENSVAERKSYPLTVNMLKFQYFTPAALIREGFLTFFLFATTAQNFRHRSNAASNDVFMNTASTIFVISFLYCSSLPRIILGRPQILPNQSHEYDLQFDSASSTYRQM